jgi:acetyltransferase-like isoleucine patch superfamily enzyme
VEHAAVVLLGPPAPILKGARLGTGAFLEAGAPVSRDVPARARVLGNPATVVGEMP